MGVLKDFGDSILDSTRDVIDAFGDNIENSADARTVAIKAAETNIQLAKARFTAEQERKDRMQKLFEGVIILLAAVLLISVAAKNWKYFIK
jgi:hypothetical protein